jgi:phage terminase small subunit
MAARPRWSLRVSGCKLSKIKKSYGKANDGKTRATAQVQQKKALEGNAGQRKLVEPEVELDISTGSLRIPTRLCTDGKAVWRDLLSSFPKWYFTAADKDLLILYCKQVALKTKLERSMKRGKLVIERGNGSECLNPRIKAISDTAALILKLAEKLQIARGTRKGLARDPNELPPAAQPTLGQTSEPVGEEPEDDVGSLMAPAIF